MSTATVRDTPLDGALWLISHGFAVFPVDHPGLEQCAGIGNGHDPATCEQRGKHPAVAFTKVHTRDEHQVHALLGTQLRNVGVFVGATTGPNGEQLLVVDSDRQGALEDAAAALGEQHVPTMRVHTAQGHHDYYWAPAGLKLGNSLGTLKGHFDGDVRAGNAYVIGPGSVHATGVVYDLDDDQQPPVAAPAWLLTALTTKPAPAPTPAGPAAPIPLAPERVDAYTRRAVQAECDSIARAADGEQNNILNTAAFSLGTLVAAGALTETEARQALLAAARAGGHPDGRAIPTIQSGLTAGMAHPRTPWPPAGRARVDDFTGLIPPQAPSPSSAPAANGAAVLTVDEPPTAPSGTAWPDTFTDDGNALLFADTFNTRIRYVAQRGTWLTWDGHRWAWDEAGHAVELGRALVRALDTNVFDEDMQKAAHRHKTGSLSRNKITAMLGLAQSDHRLTVPITALDAAPRHLNTPGGIVNLTDGTIAPSDPAALHTRSTSVAPDPSLPTPRWNAFLTDTFGGDHDMVGFVQRLAGYSASADTGTHVFPFLHGPGGNGKSVLMDVLRHLLGDYAAPAPAGFLMVGRQEHSEELARLQGLRLVVASEINPDARFDEAKLKELTGGDTLTARFMHQSFFTFEPTHHLWLMGNHQPRVKTGGDSFWRRLRLLPFQYKVPEEKKIEGLADLLVAEEGPGILAWIVQGAVDHFAKGLREPESVKAATAAYAAEEDHIGRFLEDCCTRGPAAQVRTETGRVRAAYEAWCRTEGEELLDARPFGRELKSKGIVRKPSSGKYFYAGLGLIAQGDANQPQGW
ncbi:phage/plasmid primase, P4 family [Streptomyces sp. NPDC017230]|uniref:phage/plasmid primase, P4 family n=1 Tax=unclassified Streptomyces TaxID=2593676 RepID=UPI0037A5ECA6